MILSKQKIEVWRGGGGIGWMEVQGKGKGAERLNSPVYFTKLFSLRVGGKKS